MAYTSWSGMAPPPRESTFGLDKDRVGDSNILVVGTNAVASGDIPRLSALRWSASILGQVCLLLFLLFVKRKISTPDF